MNELPVLTLLIIALTGIISYFAFSNQKLVDDLIFYPPAISKNNQWYRFITCGFIHADWMHLIFNMLSFYFFGKIVQPVFEKLFGDKGNVIYLFVYISSLAVCLVPTYIKNRNNYNYRCLGASGAVSAIVFIGVFMFPDEHYGMSFIPPIIPGFIFGPLYLVLSAMMAKRGGDNINHSAHIWGAVYGIAIYIALCFAFTKFNPVTSFINQLTEYIKTF